MRRARSAVVLALAYGAATHGEQSTRDSARLTAANASISGTVVVAGDVKLPGRRVRVTLTDVSASSPGQTATTDDSGAFVFRGLHAGSYELQAFKNAYLRASYGASRPDRAGTPIVVKDNEAVTDLKMTIVRGGVIGGLVRDTRGRPVPGVNVRVLKLGYNAVTGEPTLSPSSSGSTTITDDRGEYRAYGLPPGGYLVLVAPPSPSGRSDEPIRQLTSEEIRQAMQVARGGAPVETSSSRPSPASSRAGVNYAPVFYPSATDIRAAATITLGASEERTGVDITMQLVPTATISGTVTPVSGALPAFLSVRLVPAGAQPDMLAGAGLRGQFAQPSADGKYAFRTVAPGTYTVKALVGGGRGAPPNTPAQWAAADVTVSGQDLDVPLTLQPGVPISGRVVFDGSQPTSEELQTLSFSLIAPGSGGVNERYGGGHVDADGRFTFAGVTPDVYQFVLAWTNLAARDRWTLKASIASGQDAFESPLRITPNEPVEWVVTFTDKPTGLAGMLTDPGGRPATEYYVLVFSSDHRYWTPGSRRVRMTRPATDGSYSVKGLPSGEYYLAAPTDLETGEWNDPALLEQLVPSSAKVTLREGEMAKKDFRIGGA